MKPASCFAEVSVNSAAGRGQLFTYSIPPGLEIAPGHGVWVPFGRQTAQGIVVGLSAITAVDTVRPISALVETEPVLTPGRLSLAEWLSSYYLCPLFEALALFLPPGFVRKPVPSVAILGSTARQGAEGLDSETKKALEIIRSKVAVSIDLLRKAFGSAAVSRAVSLLEENGYIVRTFGISPPRIRPRTETVAKPSPTGTPARPLPERQAALLQYLLSHPEPAPVARLKEEGFSRALLNALLRKGLAVLQQQPVVRRPFEYRDIQLSQPLQPVPAQLAAIESIGASLQQSRPDTFLLHGVTGSGKTEVYLQALAKAISMGKQGIVLVPEIALTPQTVERFAARFPGKTAVLHSGLSHGEQFDTWHDIKKGLYDVVIGARSAIFAPLSRLGLIVIDEAHEWTYKQVDRSPRYDSRTVARRLAALTRCPLILGSATPDVESYFNAKSRIYQLLELPERLTPHPGAPMPPVEVVDLRQELKSGNLSIFSRSLKDNIRTALLSEGQVILFFNRRGTSSVVQCRSCGYPARCPCCSISMSYHGAESSLVCHQCGLRRPVPQKCPACGSRRIRFLGLGTQKVAEETAALFPGARVIRWDSDSARGKHAHDNIMGILRRREADILVGTQMVAKGLDLPRVTLVGVVSADTSLGLPDFRACERTFQLLSQVAGRAGRGEQPGKVIIQTYSPENYAVQAAKRHDYRAFYEREIAYRRELGEPPFSRLIRLTFVHVNEAACRKEAERLKRELNRDIEAGDHPGVCLVGPAPAFIPRLRGRYRWQLIIKGVDPVPLLDGRPLPRGWAVDVDPVGLS